MPVHVHVCRSSAAERRSASLVVGLQMLRYNIEYVPCFVLLDTKGMQCVVVRNVAC